MSKRIPTFAIGSKVKVMEYKDGKRTGNVAYEGTYQNVGQELVTSPAYTGMLWFKKQFMVHTHFTVAIVGVDIEGVKKLVKVPFEMLEFE